jgi:hypothetical protein
MYARYKQKHLVSLWPWTFGTILFSTRTDLGAFTSICRPGSQTAGVPGPEPRPGSVLKRPLLAKPWKGEIFTANDIRIIKKLIKRKHLRFFREFITLRVLSNQKEGGLEKKNEQKVKNYYFAKSYHSPFESFWNSKKVKKMKPRNKYSSILHRVNN